MTRDGLCRLCMLEIRMVPDHEWADAAARRTLGPVRDLQLPLLLEGVRLPVVLARHHGRWSRAAADGALGRPMDLGQEGR